jgi:transposase
LGRSRGGFSSKFHLVTDGRGRPLAVEVTAGQVHDATQVEAVLDQVAVPQPVGRPRTRPRRLAGDKGYSSGRIRDWLKRHGITPLIPHKDNEKARHDRRVKFDKVEYKRRSIVEQTIGWLKECRRICTRFEKMVVNFRAMMKLAMIQRSLRIVFSNRD